jgi:hypothetical protein
MAGRTIVLALLLVAFCQLVLGHGVLQIPKSRPILANLAGTEYCQHCLSSGGPATVQSLSPGNVYPNPTESLASSVRHTMCGESATTAAADRVYNPIKAVPAISTLPVYAPGQVMDISIEITAHHRGHFEFRMCDAALLSDPKTVTWACLAQNVLKRVSVPGEVSPVDTNHPERYYLEPECAPGYNKTVAMKYQVPSNLTCERCVLQWWWVTGNTCNPPDYEKRSSQPAHVASGCEWWQSALPKCGVSYPEEFWNCADVRVAGAAVPSGSDPRTDAPAAPPAVPTAPPAAPKAPPAAPKAPLAAPKAPPAAPKAPPAAPKAPPAAPKAPPAAPKAPPAAPKASPAAPKAPAAPANPACAAVGYQCGGDGWTGTTCCQSGLQCYTYTTTYSQCRSDCPAGWLCKTQEKSLMTAAVDLFRRVIG